MMGENLEGAQEVPPWLQTLMSNKFTDSCSVHGERLKKNILCLDCCLIFCPHCHHPPHRLLRIRRYMYNDVVYVADMKKLINMAKIQTYQSNHTNVALINIFINKRAPAPRSAQLRPARRFFVNNCRTCGRDIQKENCYCSLHCKVKELLRKEGDLSKCLRDCESPPMLSSPELDEGHLTHLSPDSILDPTSSGSAASMAGGLAATLSTGALGFPVRRRRSRRVSASAEAPNAVPDQPSGSGSQGGPDLRSRSRRKQRDPQRAPLSRLAGGI